MKDIMKIGELADKALVSRRTIRYYVQKELIPPPVQKGAYSYYNEWHLKRILLIRKLQGYYWPLDRIQKELRDIPDEKLSFYLEDTSWPTENSQSVNPLLTSWKLSSESNGMDKQNNRNKKQNQFERDSKRNFQGKEYYRLMIIEGVELHISAFRAKSLPVGTDAFYESLQIFFNQYL